MIGSNHIVSIYAHYLSFQLLALIHAIDECFDKAFDLVNNTFGDCATLSE